MTCLRRRDRSSVVDSDAGEHRMTDHLAAALRPPGGGAALAATKHAGLARVEPLTTTAEAWLRSYAGTEASWDGDALVVEMRYFSDLADAAIAAGLTFERDALPC